MIQREFKKLTFFISVSFLHKIIYKIKYCKNTAYIISFEFKQREFKKLTFLKFSLFKLK